MSEENAKRRDVEQMHRFLRHPPEAPPNINLRREDASS